MGDITLVSSIFVLIFVTAIWVLAVRSFFRLGLGLHPVLFYAAAGFLLVIIGVAMYYARTPQDWIPYLNLYGQIVMIGFFSWLVRKCMLIGNNNLLFSPMSIPTKFLDGGVFYFVILNGFVFPILMPLLYHHFRATEARWRVILFALILRVRLKKIDSNQNKEKKQDI